MRHLRLSYVILAACAALLVYGLVEGTSRTSALFVGERQATGGVDASVAFPASATPTHAAPPTSAVSPTVGPTEAPSMEVPGATAEPASTEPASETLTPGPELSATAAQSPTRAPRTAGPATVSPTPEGCQNTAFLTLAITSSEGGPFEVEVKVANEGEGEATNVVLGFSITDGWEFVDEGVFGDGQLWWPHGQPDTGVIVAAGDIAAGTTTSIFLVLNPYPDAADGSPIVLNVSVLDGDCLDSELDAAETTLIVDSKTEEPVETPGTTRTPAVDATKTVAGTPALKTTPERTATPEVEETPDATETPSETATNTAVPTTTSTAVPTSTSTATPTQDTTGGGGNEQGTIREVEGEQAVPASPTPTPRPLGQLLPDTGDGYELPGGGSLELYVGVALLALCLGGAALVGRRM